MRTKTSLLRSGNARRKLRARMRAASFSASGTASSRSIITPSASKTGMFCSIPGMLPGT